MDFITLAGNFWYTGEGEIMYSETYFQLCLINCGDGFPGAEDYDEHVIKDFYLDGELVPDRIVHDQGLEVITKMNWPRVKFRQTSYYLPPDGGLGELKIEKVSIAPSNAPRCYIEYEAQVDDFGSGMQFSGAVMVAPM